MSELLPLGLTEPFEFFLKGPAVHRVVAALRRGPELTRCEATLRVGVEGAVLGLPLECRPELVRALVERLERESREGGVVLSLRPDGADAPEVLWREFESRSRGRHVPRARGEQFTDEADEWVVTGDLKPLLPAPLPRGPLTTARLLVWVLLAALVVIRFVACLG